jgi:hypothetical protein
LVSSLGKRELLKERRKWILKKSKNERGPVSSKNSTKIDLCAENVNREVFALLGD